MLFSCNARQIGFSLFDYLKGSPINRHLRDLEYIFTHPEELQRESKLRTENILDHACKTTRYYRSYLGATELADFPIIEKREIAEHYYNFLSSSYDKANLVSVTTSGSYGTPFTFHLTKAKRARQQAEIIFFSRWAGYKLGQKHISLRLHQKSKFALFLENQILMGPEVIDLTWLEEVRRTLIRSGVRFLIGYSSNITALTQYCESREDSPDKYSLEGIIFSSESMDSAIVETAERVYGCKVLGRYAAAEFGVVAHQCVRAKKYHLNLASYNVELLSLDSDTPVCPGEIGRIVVTDYFSHAMPLIRYDTGDLAVLSREECICGIKSPVFERIEGRRLETIFNTRGQKVTISGFMSDLDSIIQFQLIQTDKCAYTLVLCVLPSFSHENTILNRLHSKLGDDASITLEYVSSIEPLPSGKRPYVINKWICRNKGTFEWSLQR